MLSLVLIASFSVFWTKASWKNMALRNLVDAQCGEGNALLRLTQHVTQDKALLDEGLRRPNSGPPAEGTVF